MVHPMISYIHEEVRNKDGKRAKQKEKKSPVNWIEIAVQFLTGLITGIIILIIDKLWK